MLSKLQTLISLYNCDRVTLCKLHNVCPLISFLVDKLFMGRSCFSTIGIALDCESGDTGFWFQDSADHSRCDWSWNFFYGHSHCTSALTCTEVSVPCLSVCNKSPHQICHYYFMVFLLSVCLFIRFYLLMICIQSITLNYSYLIHIWCVSFK
jgi:hypothetical protein